MDGNIVPDFPLVNKSFNLCYACADAVSAFERSLGIRHLVCGSCNALRTRGQRAEQRVLRHTAEGWDFVASPRHADVVTVTGPMTRRCANPALATLAATPRRFVVVAVGDCASGTGPWAGAPQPVKGAGIELDARCASGLSALARRDPRRLTRSLEAVRSEGLARSVRGLVNHFVRLDDETQRLVERPAHLRRAQRGPGRPELARFVENDVIKARTMPRRRNCGAT